jgi:hypothetical protein
MTPSQTSQALRHIAANIQNSKSPDRKLVAKDLRSLLAAFLDPQDPNYPYEASKEDPYGFDLKEWADQVRSIMDQPKNPEEIISEIQEMLSKIA